MSYYLSVHVIKVYSPACDALHRFANPSNLESDQLPPGLDTWDPTSYFASALPIFAAVLGINLSHEIGHRLAVGVA